MEKLLNKTNYTVTHHRLLLVVVYIIDITVYESDKNAVFLSFFCIFRWMISKFFSFYFLKNEEIRSELNRNFDYNYVNYIQCMCNNLIGYTHAV